MKSEYRVIVTALSEVKARELVKTLPKGLKIELDLPDPDPMFDTEFYEVSDRIDELANFNWTEASDATTLREAKADYNRLTKDLVKFERLFDKLKAAMGKLAVVVEAKGASVNKPWRAAK